MAEAQESALPTVKLLKELVKVLIMVAAVLVSGPTPFLSSHSFEDINMQLVPETTAVTRYSMSVTTTPVRLLC